MELKKKTFIKQKDKDSLPRNIEESIDILNEFYGEQLTELINVNDEETFVTIGHHGGGQFMRNEWFLWWHPNHGYKEWPKEQPELNKWFESIGITHADDISSIILHCLYRKFKNQPYDIEKQVEYYQKHWKECGFSDGIPIH